MHKKTRNSLPKKKQGQPKKQGKEDQGGCRSYTVACGATVGHLAGINITPNKDKGVSRSKKKKKKPCPSSADPKINKLKTTLTPNKNGSYGTKGGGSYAIFWGSVCHIFCRNPLILTDSYAIRTPIVWHILGAYFFQMYGGWGWSELLSELRETPASYREPFRPLGSEF